MIGLSLLKRTSVWRAFILASAFLPLAQVAHAATDAILQSNFESGLSGWSPTDRSLDNGNLSVTTAARLALTAHGLSAVVNDTRTLYVQDNTPSREGQYRVRFYFSPNGFKTGSATARVRLLNAYDSSLDRSVVEVFLQQAATGAYSVGASYRLNDRSLLTTPLTPISNGPHYVEFNWKRSTTRTARDGVFQLWVDNQPTASVATLTTGALGVDYARFGAVTGLNSLSQGTLFLDQFVSRRLSYIGPEQGGTPPSPAPSPTPTPSPTPRPSPTPTPRPSPTPTPVPSPTPIPIPSPTPTPTPTPSPVPTPPPSGGLPIGEWTDSPGACPSGTTVVTLNSVSAIASAARGEGAYASNPASTCYFIQNGTYHQSGSTMLMLIEKGGAAGAPRRFVGQSRDGVVLVGRANVDVGVQHVVIQNLTFSLTGYSQSGSFNTMDVSGGSGDVLVDHVTFTGDCNTGANGGHIETNGVDGLVVQNSLIEKFGRCGTSAGHQDHGIYLAGASNVTLFNNIIRGNSSRGIQMYTQGGQYGTLNNITVRQNRIYQNGHADYEDGMVINGSGSGTITNVSIDHNLIYRNYYSGIRFAGPATMSISVVDNTFEGNGAGSASSARSEINIDDSGNGAHATMQGNIFSVGNTLINNCYNATSLGFGITDNVVFGKVPTGTAGNCVSQVVNENPLFVNASAGDYHTTNPDVSQYGPY